MLRPPIVPILKNIQFCILTDISGKNTLDNKTQNRDERQTAVEAK